MTRELWGRMIKRFISHTVDSVQFWVSDEFTGMMKWHDCFGRYSPALAGETPSTSPGLLIPRSSNSHGTATFRPRAQTMASVRAEGGGGVNLFVNPPQQERWSLTARRDQPNTGPFRFTTSFCWRFSKCQGRLNKSLSWRCCARAHVRVCVCAVCTFLCTCSLLTVRGEVCAANTHYSKYLEIPFVLVRMPCLHRGGGCLSRPLHPTQRVTLNQRKVVWCERGRINHSSPRVARNQVVPPVGWPSARGPPKLTVLWRGGPCPPLPPGE